MGESVQTISSYDQIRKFIHEISSPLGICVTNISVLEEMIEGFTKEYEKGLKKSTLIEFLNKSSQIGKILSFNINRSLELLEYLEPKKIENSIKVIKFDLKELLKVLTLGLCAKYKNIRIEISAPEQLEIYSIPGKISQIFTNLIENSVNHGFENMESGLINIKITKLKNEIIINYSDNGHGIPDHQIKNIFCKPRSTKEDKNNHFGFGIPIIHEAVTKDFNGSISCQNGEREGILFKIVLPVI